MAWLPVTYNVASNKPEYSALFIYLQLNRLMSQRPSIISKKTIKFVLLALLLIIVLIRLGWSAPPIATNLVGYNHTDQSIGHFSVDGKEGSFLAAHSIGGFICCMSVPNPWSPGMEVTVGWTDRYDRNYQEHRVPVPKYDAQNTAQMSVHFLRNGTIKVFVPSAGLGNRDYPLKGPEAELTPGVSPIWK